VRDRLHHHHAHRRVRVVKISEVIFALEAIKDTHGDLDVHLIDGFASWRLPPLRAVRYTTDLVPGMRNLGGERSLVRFGDVRVTSDFSPEWRRHVREAGFYDAVVLTEHGPEVVENGEL
jgi:hypothetical protein